MKQTVIIGGGASGLMAAIYAAKNNKVTIVEKNNDCGKKILVTGNGRCNYFNVDMGLIHYNSSDLRSLEKIMTKENQRDVLVFFAKIGIVPKIKNGYYYPYSNQASSIRNALLLEAKLRGVQIINARAEEIIYNGEYFIINPSADKIIADKIVLATGSKAGVKDNTLGYDLVKSLGHKVNPILPSLVQLRGEGKFFKLWNGIRCEAKVSLFENGNKVKEQYGELQLTDYGISGICVFNLSGIVSKGLKANKNELVKINFVPWLEDFSLNDFINWLDDRNKIVLNRSISELLEGFLNYKLVNTILEVSKIKPSCLWDELNTKEKNILAKNICEFNLNIIGTNSFDKAQVCSGGVPLQEINPETMESKIVKNLYITGELLDVDGQCGGYNLGFAWVSGMLAGKGIK